MLGRGLGRPDLNIKFRFDTFTQTKRHFDKLINTYLLKYNFLDMQYT